MQELMPKDWYLLLENEWRQSYFKNLLVALNDAYQTKKIYPNKDAIFNAFKLCSLESTKVVILGQDPYHGPNQAHGLAFSVKQSCNFPPSLRNIFKELIDDIGTTPMHGDLSHWAKQGVLLLNSTLTVEDGKAGSHQKYGWETFTDQVISKLSEHKQKLIFVLWGAFAIKKIALIDTNKHQVITSAHPSPLSAYRGFLGSKPFSMVNSHLKDFNLKPIVW
ncbi:MAG: uracil-DNA glycosylase [Flavobacteriales bacterium]|jgi:uracil-DNA glycosylase